MSNERSSTAIDAYVGRRLKQRREELGLSQERLADLLGISFQQVQKYERGFNRVGASRLFQIGEALSVQTAFFFEGLEPVRGGVGEEKSGNDPLSVAALLAAPGAMELLAEYAKVKSVPQRKKIVELVRLFANEQEG